MLVTSRGGQRFSASEASLKVLVRSRELETNGDVTRTRMAQLAGVCVEVGGHSGAPPWPTSSGAPGAGKGDGNLGGISALVGGRQRRKKALTAAGGSPHPPEKPFRSQVKTFYLFHVFFPSAHRRTDTVWRWTHSSAPSYRATHL